MLRQGLFSLLFLFLWTGLLEAKDVNLFGKWISRDDYLVGRISTQSGKYATVNLGYRHGLIEETRMLILRSKYELYRPLSFVIVVKVNRNHSLVRLEKSARLQKDDLVVIPAEHLDLWHGLDRRKDSIVHHSIYKRKYNGYDGRGRFQNGKDVRRELAAEASRKYDYFNKFNNETKVSIQYQNQKFQSSDPKAIEELKLKANSLLPSESEWFRHTLRTVLEDGWEVLITKNQKIRPERGKKQLPEMLSESFKRRTRR